MTMFAVCKQDSFYRATTLRRTLLLTFHYNIVRFRSIKLR